MSKNQTIQKASRFGVFLARHLFALLVTATVPCALWTLVYAGLFIWAATTNAGLGDPATYPFGLGLSLFVGIVVAITILFPCTALAEWLGQRHALPRVAQIPISIAWLAGFCLIISSVMASLDLHPTLNGIFVRSGWLFLAHLLPLGLYWWAAQSWLFMASLCQRLRHDFHSRVSCWQLQRSRRR